MRYLHGTNLEPTIQKNPLVQVQLQACKQAEKCKKNPTEFKTPSAQKKKKKKNFLFLRPPLHSDAFLRPSLTFSFYYSFLVTTHTEVTFSSKGSVALFRLGPIGLYLSQVRHRLAPGTDPCIPRHKRISTP
jgi:hypothetical protein